MLPFLFVDGDDAEVEEVKSWKSCWNRYVITGKGCQSARRDCRVETSLVVRGASERTTNPNVKAYGSALSLRSGMSVF